MKRTILKIICALFAAAIVTAPTLSPAQDAMSTNAPAATDQPVPVKVKKRSTIVFNGKLSAVDTNAMTFTVSSRTFEITSDTRITKDGKPATLSDGVVGEMVGGAYKKTEDGKLTATSVHFGVKMKKKQNPDSTGSSTNSAGN
jgi:hypothetical protein